VSDNVVSAADRDSAELAVLVAILAVVVVILVAVDEYPDAEAIPLDVGDAKSL